MAEALNPCLHGYLSSFLLGLVRVVYDNTQYLQNYWQFRRTHLFSNWYSRKTSDSDTRFYVHSKGREVSSNDWLMVHSRGGGSNFPAAVCTHAVGWCWQLCPLTNGEGSGELEGSTKTPPSNTDGPTTQRSHQKNTFHKLQCTLGKRQMWLRENYAHERDLAKILKLANRQIDLAKVLFSWVTKGWKDIV